LERNYRGFCNAAQHYIYYVVPVSIGTTSLEISTSYHWRK